jgi:TRAP-type C4-dicarboxylate transport system permease large subunit
MPLAHTNVVPPEMAVVYGLNLRMPGSLFIAQINLKVLSTLFCTFVNKIHAKHKATRSLGRPRHRWGETVYVCRFCS